MSALKASTVRVGDIKARVVPHPENADTVLCCGIEWNTTSDTDFVDHLMYRHYYVISYTADEMRDALVPLFLEAPYET